MDLNITCPHKVVETTSTNAKFLKVSNCAEICHHEPSLGTGSKYGLKLGWVGVRSRGRETWVVRCLSSWLKWQAKNERVNHFYHFMWWFKQESKTRGNADSSSSIFLHGMAHQSKVRWISIDMELFHYWESPQQKTLIMLWILMWEVGWGGGLGVEKYVQVLSQSGA